MYRNIYCKTKENYFKIYRLSLLNNTYNRKIKILVMDEKRLEKNKCQSSTV